MLAIQQRDDLFEAGIFATKFTLLGATATVKENTTVNSLQEDAFETSTIKVSVSQRVE